MIRPLDIEKDLHLDKEDLAAAKKKMQPKSSSKVMVLIGGILLLFVFGAMGMKVLNASLQKPQLQKSKVASQNIKILQPKSLTSIDAGMIMEQVQKSGIGQQLVKAGQEVGAAVLGATVKFVQNKASESAPMVASAAANLVIQSAVPALVDQIKKLPAEQQKQVKKMICE